MDEIAVVIGNRPQLVGVYTQCKADTAIASMNRLPTILLINSGLLPHIGPYRLYVRLARQFASLGFNTLRFDLSGIGDSERSKDNISNDDRDMRDIDSVVDYLEQNYDQRQFIIMGICTGAANAHKAMTRDERIVGAVCIDGYYFLTHRYYINKFAPKLIRLNSWITLGKRAKKMICSKFKTHSVTAPKSIVYRWTHSPKLKISDDYKSFIKRNVNLLCVFTGSWRYNYPGQMADAFKHILFGDNIKVVYMEDAEHMFPLMEDRQKLAEVIMSWLSSRFKGLE